MSEWYLTSSEVPVGSVYAGLTAVGIPATRCTSRPLSRSSTGTSRRPVGDNAAVEREGRITRLLGRTEASSPKLVFSCSVLTVQALSPTLDSPALSSAG